jgi:hypothetical protein
MQEIILNEKVLDILDAQHSNVNKVYDIIVGDGLTKFSSLASFSDICEKSISIYLQYNDYIHSNNILQVFRTIVDEHNWPSWFHYYSLVIYSKRVPKYYLENPNLFWERVRLASIDNKINKDSLEIAIVYYLKSAVELANKYNDNILLLIDKFSDYYLTKKINFSMKINSLILRLKMANQKAVDEQNFNKKDFINSLSDVEITAIPEAKVEIDFQIEQDIKINNDKSKIIIIGDTAINENIILGIAKEYGYAKYQIEIHSDYTKIKSRDFDFIKYNSNYIGIIVGPVPHSSKSSGEYSSLLSKLESEQGYPKVSRALASGALKITKTSLKKSFEEITVDYLKSRANEI